jgi:thioredoxin 1
MLYITDDNDLDLKGLTIVKFSAEWCTPCKRMQTLLEKMEKEFSNVTFLDVDVDKCNSLAKKYKIMTLPTLLFFDNKKEKDRLIGLVLTEPLRKKIKNFIK